MLVGIQNLLSKACYVWQKQLETFSIVFIRGDSIRFEVFDTTIQKLLKCVIYFNEDTRLIEIVTQNTTTSEYELYDRYSIKELQDLIHQSYRNQWNY